MTRCDSAGKGFAALSLSSTLHYPLPMIGTIQTRVFSGWEIQPFGVEADVRRLKLLRFYLRFVN